jgi:hypothetical protein
MRHLAAPFVAALLLSQGVVHAAPEVVGPPKTAWKDLTKEQKGKFMKAVVTPKMKTTFQAFDPVMFKKFNCATCHGKKGEAREYKMPNPEMAALPSTPEAFGAKMKEKPSWEKWAKFMGEKVEPEVAGLLGLPLYDPKKPEPGQFGCTGCHTLEKEKKK